METGHRLTDKKGKCKKKSTGFKKYLGQRITTYFNRDLAGFSVVIDLKNFISDGGKFIMSRKKHGTSEEKKLENTTEKSSDIQNTNSSSDNLAKMISNAVRGLSYMSETDAEITLFRGKTSTEITKNEILAQSGSEPDAPVEEKDFASFFKRLTEIQDWYGDEEKETVRKFSQLQAVLENNLRDLTVFRIGKVELKIYVVGLDEENTLLGIKTEAVETGD